MWNLAFLHSYILVVFKTPSKYGQINNLIMFHSAAVGWTIVLLSLVIKPRPSLSSAADPRPLRAEEDVSSQEEPGHHRGRGPVHHHRSRHRGCQRG